MITIAKKTPLSRICELAPPCDCSACSYGCSVGSGFLAANDIDKLAKHLGIGKDELKEKYLEETEAFNTKLLRPKQKRNGKPYGECVFHENGKCKVHSSKPLQCKITMGCKEYNNDLQSWFILNNMINENDPESIRQYAIYLETGGYTITGGKLDELVPDKTRLNKMLSFEMLK